MINYRLKTKEAYLHFLINDTRCNKKEFLSFVLKNMSNHKEIGYMGHKTKKEAISVISNSIFGKSNNHLSKFEVDLNKISKIISKTLKLCNKVVNSNKIYIFIFPTNNPFIIKNMRGVSGYCPWKKTILLFLNNNCDWELALKETICHEYAHTFSHKNHNWITLEDSIVFEGIAEHFRENVIGGKHALWTLALKKSEVKTLFQDIKDSLNDESYGSYVKALD